MKKIIIALSAAMLMVTAGFTAELKTRDFNVTEEVVYEGTSAAKLFEQSEKVKAAYPAFKKEIDIYTEMLDDSDEAYDGVTTVDKYIQKVCDLDTPLWDAAESNQKSLMKAIDGRENPYVRKDAHDASVTALQKENAALRTTHANDVAALKNAHASDVSALKGKLSDQESVLTDLTRSSHAVGLYDSPKFHGYKTLNFENGETAICSTEVSLTTAEQTDLAALCVADAGKVAGNDNVRFYPGYSTEDSGIITFVRMPYTVKRSNVAGWLNHYNVSAAAKKGLRNGPDYQSAVPYSGGKVITSDKQEYSNSPTPGSKKASAMKVIVVNSDKNPVNTKAVQAKETESKWFWQK